MCKMEMYHHEMYNMSSKHDHREQSDSGMIVGTHAASQ